jgi:hypothetical protein
MLGRIVFFFDAKNNETLRVAFSHHTNLEKI